jgi:hypothetical protein
VHATSGVHGIDARGGRWVWRTGRRHVRSVARIRLLATTATVVLAACAGATTAPEDAPAVDAPARSDAMQPSAPPSPAVDAPTATGDVPSDPGQVGEPPDLLVTSAAGTSRRRPSTFCWMATGAGLCVDGRPRFVDPVDVRGPLHLSLPLEDRTLTVTRWHDRDDPEGPRVPLRTTGIGAWVVAEQLPVGRHLLGIAGRGPEGDAYWVVPVTMLDGS